MYTIFYDCKSCREILVICMLIGCKGLFDMKIASLQTSLYSVKIKINSLKKWHLNI